MPQVYVSPTVVRVLACSAVVVGIEAVIGGMVLLVSSGGLRVVAVPVRRIGARMFFWGEIRPPALWPGGF